MQLPVPEIYIQIKTNPEGESKYIVVDGQQRITAILEFIGSEQREPFELRYLDPNSRWRGYTFEDLTDEQKSNFYGHSMAVRDLQEANDDSIEDLFRRLNRYLTPLNAQELRNATYSGPFVRLSESIAEDPFWSENRLVSPPAIRRMRDIEFISDLLIGVLHGPQSSSAKTVDDYYATYEDFSREFPGQRDCKRRFERSLELLQEMFVDIRTTRWSNRTDFYTLFVAMAHQLREHIFPLENLKDLECALNAFEVDIRGYQETGVRNPNEHVVAYVEAMRRGSSDRFRRGVRHQVMLEIMSPHSEPRRR